ncbi:tail assembly protein [Vibrio barjaei]|uniref:Tail assembly protein n=2 Tax=Vibrio TaxID=662 RepID=A0ABW7ID30_9VIBR
MAIVRFYGDLQRFGRRFKLEVSTTSEALRALLVQIPDLQGHMAKGQYRVRIKRHDVMADSMFDEVLKPIGQKDVIHVLPVVTAAQKGGVWQVVAGAVLIVAAFYTGGASLAAWGALSTGMAAAGASMVLSGVATMLTDVPDLSDRDTVNNGQTNQYFTSLQNQVAQGGCVPVLIGECMIGGKILSQGLRTE